MEIIIKDTFMGLNYEITNTKDTSRYSVYDLGKVTNEKINLAFGSSCEQKFTVHYMEEVIKGILGVE